MSSGPGGSPSSGSDRISAPRSTSVAPAAMRHVVFAPIGFLADHVEILYDLDIEARALGRRARNDVSPHALAERLRSARPGARGSARRRSSTIDGPPETWPARSSSSAGASPGSARRTRSSARPARSRSRWSSAKRASAGTSGPCAATGSSSTVAPTRGSHRSRTRPRSRNRSGSSRASFRPAPRTGASTSPGTARSIRSRKGWSSAFRPR